MKTYRIPDKKMFESFINRKPTHLFLLKNKRGMELALTDYGARVVSIMVPDRKGNMVDVALGFSSIKGYLEANEAYHGATIGRYANRIANGKFNLKGKEYTIKPNNGVNALHGGAQGFDKKVWDRRVSATDTIEFYLVSPDGDEGFPGTLTVTVSYALTEENELVIKYRAETDKTTVISLTNHTFFNLNGEGGGAVTNHEMQINAKAYLPVNEQLIPLGEPKNVEGTDFDFRRRTPLTRIVDSRDSQVRSAKGYDHNFNLSTGGSSLEIAGAAFSPQTGIRMEVRTTEPGMQLYTGNFLNGSDIGKSGRKYEQHGAFCLETQKYPDSPNQDKFPSCVLNPGEVFLSETVYKFAVEK